MCGEWVSSETVVITPAVTTAQQSVTHAAADPASRQQLINLEIHVEEGEELLAVLLPLLQLVMVPVDQTIRTRQQVCFTCYQFTLLLPCSEIIHRMFVPVPLFPLFPNIMKILH